MKLIAKKACSFGGKKFFIGEEIPCDLVLNPKNQASMGVLAIVPDEKATEIFASPQEGVVKFTIPIRGDGEEFAVSVTNEELILVTDVLQATAEKAALTISTIETESPLILIDALDGRKAVKKAVKERVDVLIPDEEKEPEEAAQEATEGGDA